MPKRSDQPPFAIHCQIASGPNRRQPHITGEDRIIISKIADRLRNLLRVYRWLAMPADRKIIEALARLAIMFKRLIEVDAVTLLLKGRQQCLDRCTHIAHHTDIYRRPAPYNFCP
jgi:hypothetical protein